MALCGHMLIFLGGNVAKHRFNKGLATRIYKVLTTWSEDKNQKLAKDLNRHFAQGSIWIANKHVGRCSVSFVTRKMQTQTTRRYHHRTLGMADTEKNDSSERWRNWSPHTLLVGMEKDAATLEHTLAVS